MKKKSIFILMILIFLGYIRSETIQAQEKVVIGEMQDNKPVVTMSLDLIKYNLEGYLKANEAKSVLTEITIKYSGNTYVLYACNKFKTIKTIVKLELIEGKFYESVETCGGSLVVSCKSTSKIDYEPEITDCKGICSFNGDGTCTKIETLSETPIFPDHRKTF